MHLNVDTIIFHAGEGGTLPPEALQTLAEAARSCRIIAFPTDTVYGLGSTGLIKAAARRIYQMKARPSIKPLPILVWSTDEAKRWVEWTESAEKLSKQFWPGALTLVLKPTAAGRILTFAEYQTIAIRVPNNPLLLDILKVSQVPWVSTSANISGLPALSVAADVVKTFRGLADFIVATGDAPGGESTVVDATQKTIRILREGNISPSQILEVCPSGNAASVGAKQ
jgi:L-threonylcarbamoyladenylate synthase